ncbi:MAG: aldo/keto reductase [Rhodococcus sp. (in: high G+C Gram-positive bacteria)]|uniref:aldo/keto reductase n=1 Tax=Rhodococcus sp. EPR-157 TaxID=1813677 RepID=UPI0007BB7F53|nr:aldo/keto reductase [Rhodococcus sp. EPR-157]KZF09378.1 aldo/keto reductase [Rhodococcus sp. EPR-157]
MTNPTRRIPALDRDVSAVGFGCMGINWAYSTVNPESSRAGSQVLAHALESGIDFFDTSDAYAAGENETVVGRALAGADVLIATKGGLIGSIVDGRPTIARNGRPEHLRQACDNSLRRLGIDTIDLYYLHRIDEQVPIEESWGALSELVEAGKVRALGLSEVTTKQADTAHAIHPVAAVQSELSVWTRDALGDGYEVGNIVEWSRARDAVFVAFSPLGRGFLTGELNTENLSSWDFRSTLPRFNGEAAQQNRAIVDAVAEVARRHETTSAAIALAWVLAQGPHVIPIPGTTKTRHLDANLSAAQLVLTAEDLDILDNAPSAVGTRY